VAEQLIAVTIKLPAREWWKLARLAELRGDKVADLVAERAVRAPAGRPPRAGSAPTSERVAELHAQGLTDTEVAHALMISNTTARYHRLRAGLPLNAARP
jgi:DNA-binding NarL/FixJ family response regulator